MKANELRIGNYINWQVGRSIMQGTITSLSTVSIVVDHKSTFKVKSEADTYRLIPIPLTEEWLLKFGFEKLGGYLWNCKKLGENRFLNNPYSVTHFEIKGHSSNSHIKYVHQLQNLYFALTGEEL